MIYVTSARLIRPMHIFIGAYRALSVKRPNHKILLTHKQMLRSPGSGRSKSITIVANQRASTKPRKSSI